MMKYIKVIILACTLLSMQVNAQELAKDDKLAIEQLISNLMTGKQIPGLSIAIVMEGKLVWSNGYGFADLENLIPAKSNTAYRSASIGKSITATAIMQLVEQGKIDLDKPIQEYCPYFPKKKWVITTRHLLNHTSGIRHYGGINNDKELISSVHYANVTTPLDIFKNDNLLFEPGTKHTYSTYGYNVLGCVLERASKQPFMNYLKENIFVPAEMKSTQADDPRKIISNRASGYATNTEGSLLNAEYVDMSNKLPAGGYITTAEDLALFAKNFMNHSLVKAETKEVMLTPNKTSTNEQFGYGFGWALFPGEKWVGQREAFHTGGTPGVSGVLYLMPDIGFAIAILMNLEGVQDERVDLAGKIAKVILE